MNLLESETAAENGCAGRQRYELEQETNQGAHNGRETSSHQHMPKHRASHRVRLHAYTSNEQQVLQKADSVHLDK